MIRLMGTIRATPFVFDTIRIYYEEKECKIFYDTTHSNNRAIFFCSVHCDSNFFLNQPMNEELLNTFNKLFALSDETLQTFDKSKIIVQYSNDVMLLEESEFKKLSDSAEIDRCLQLWKKLNENEYLLVAYHDAKIIGGVKRVDRKI